MAAQIAFDTMTLVPSADVATNGSLTFNYPAGRAKADYAQAGEIMIASGLQATFNVGASNFSLVYGTPSVVITYLGATTLPAGKQVTLQAPLTTYQALADLTDSTGGVASTTKTLVDATSTYSQAIANANVATLAAQIKALNAKVTMLIGNAKLFDKIPQ